MADSSDRHSPVWLRTLAAAVIAIVALCAGYAVAIAAANFGRIGV
jgi:hypothetical protein